MKESSSKRFLELCVSYFLTLVNFRFLVDGFPRKMDQALKFEEKVVDAKFILYFEWYSYSLISLLTFDFSPEEEMLKRLLKRGETSGRVDDNIESIKKRFDTFKETSYPVIDYFKKQGRVRTVYCKDPVDKVYASTKKAVIESLSI